MQQKVQTLTQQKEYGNITSVGNGGFGSGMVQPVFLTAAVAV